MGMIYLTIVFAILALFTAVVLILLGRKDSTPYDQECCWKESPVSLKEMELKG